MRWPLGVVSVTYPRDPVEQMARRARADGFAHVDVLWDAPDDLALPIGDRLGVGRPRAGCTTGALPEGEGAWDKTVELFRAVPGGRLEPWAGSCTASVAAVREMVAAVPGLRLTLDTGHVADWGEDPVELLDLADHVQLRQARCGESQTLDGDVDFAQVFRRLEALDYRGLLSVEYFDLPERGWPLDDPVGHAVELARRLRPLLS